MQQRKLRKYKLPLEYPLNKALEIYINRLFVFFGVVLFFALTFLLVLTAPAILADSLEIITRSSEKTSLDSTEVIRNLAPQLDLIVGVLTSSSLFLAVIRAIFQYRSSRKK